MKTPILMIIARADIGGGPKALHDQARTITEKHPEFSLFIAAPDRAHYSAGYHALAEEFFPIPHRKLSVRRLLSLMAFCRRRRIKLVHSHGRGGGYYARFLKLAGCRVIHSFHGVALPTGSLRERMHRRLDAALRFCTDHFISVAPAELANARRLNLIGRRPVTVIPNGIRLAWYRATDETARHTLEQRIARRPGEVLLGTLTRLESVKNNAALLEHCMALPQHYRLVIAGEGEEQAQLMCRVAQMGLNARVQFLGPLEHAREFLQLIDIYVSASQYEGLPIAVIEAMAVGKPCVLSAIAGHAALVPQEMLFAAASSEAFAARITAANPKPVYANLEQYDIIAVTARLVGVYRCMCS